jgi:flagellar protein FliL
MLGLPPKLLSRTRDLRFCGITNPRPSRFGYRLAIFQSIMATNETAVEGSAVGGASGTANVPFVPLIIAVVVAAAISVAVVGGGAYWLARSGRLSLPATALAATKAESSGPVATHAMVLEPLVVNLADADGKAYLRVAVTLRVVDADDKKEAKTKEEQPKGSQGDDEDQAAVRDTLLTVLGRDSSDALLAADGKQHVKEELKAALTEHASGVKVADIFFTEFLVQR